MNGVYEINVFRDGKWWMVEIPGIDGLTQARRLSEVKKMAREYIALSCNVAVDEVSVIVGSIKVDGKEYARRQAQLLAARVARVEAEERERTLADKLAHELAAESIPVRDIGELLDLSYQRAQQIIHS